MTIQDSNLPDNFLGRVLRRWLGQHGRLCPYLYGLIDAGMLFSRLPLSSLRSRLERYVPQQQAEYHINYQAPFFALWGAIIALISLLPSGLMVWLGLPQPAPMIWAVLVAVMITGALHEDGLADCADGWFGSHLPERRREIMKDSRLGSFGALALIFSVVLRLLPLSLLPLPTAMVAFVAAHILGRGLLPLGWTLLRGQHSTKISLTSSMAAQIPDLRHSAMAALLTVLLILPMIPLGIMAFLPMIVFLVIMAVLALSRRKIGVITGDSLGAAEQVAEITVLWLVLWPMALEA